MIVLRRSPTKGPLKESGKATAHLPKGVFLLQALATFNVCFTNSQEFNSLVANSAKLDGITSEGNNDSTTVRNISKERLNVINNNISANSTERSSEVINNSSSNSTEKLNEVINNYSSIERSNEVNDITVNESNDSGGRLNEVNAINLNVAVVENVPEMESVDGSATSGRPLIEVIDEGQVDLSSDGIESRTLLPLHHSPLYIFSDPPPDFADAMDEGDSPPPPPPTSSPPSLPPLLVKLGLAMRGVAFALERKVCEGLLVFVSPRFLSLCLASTFCRKLLLANQKGLVFALVLPLRSLICSSPLQQLHSIF